MASPEKSYPLISIIIPCLNEATVIAKCLDSVLANDYPKESLEVWVVDGMSKDGTRGIVGEYNQKFPFIKLIDNPQLAQQSALNLGIARARGEIIIRMDAHCGFSTNYISQCVRYLMESGADNVGGRLVTVPRADTLSGRAIAIAMSKLFGVGNSRFRVWRHSDDLEPRWVHTVPYSCYRREVFDRIGLFNEQLERSEDAEFHLRMREAGCKTLFVPSIVSYYYSRSDLKSFWMHAVDNGFWAVMPTMYTGRLVVSLRHLAPLGLVAGLGGLAGLALSGWFSPIPLAVLAGSYAVANLGVSARVALEQRDVRMLFVLPVVFGGLHFGYGIGSFIGAWKVLKSSLFRWLWRRPMTTGR